MVGQTHTAVPALARAMLSMHPHPPTLPSHRRFTVRCPTSRAAEGHTDLACRLPVGSSHPTAAPSSHCPRARGSLLTMPLPLRVYSPLPVVAVVGRGGGVGQRGLAGVDRD